MDITKERYDELLNKFDKLLDKYDNLLDRFENYKLSKQASYEATQKEVIALTKDLREERTKNGNLVEALSKKETAIEQLRERLGDTKSSKLYEDLLEVIKPYLSDFTGYDEEMGCFNIVLAVKELLEDLSNNKIVIPSFSVNIPPEVETGTVRAVLDIVKKAVKEEINKVLEK